MANERQAGIRRALNLTTAWIPLFLFFSGLVYLSGASLPMGMEVGARFTGTAALLGLAVHRLTGLMPWPDRIRLSFYVGHVAAAFVFSALWLAFAIYLDHPLQPSLAVGALVGDVLAPSRILFGTWMYGLVAGVSYTVRGRVHLLEARRSEEEARAQAAEARFQALESRLDPHFLYNALHTVGALVTRDPSGAQDAVERLGHMLRYVLERPPGTEVRLESEWHFTLEYLEFAKLRMGPRLQVEDRLDSLAGQALVPPLVLQPLVENAVRHGVSRRPEGGVVRIVGDLVEEGTELRLTVCDDGPGESGCADEADEADGAAGADAADTVDEADEADGATGRAGADAELGWPEGLNGNGLVGLRKRLALRYPEGASVVVQSSGQGGFEVCVRLPFERGEGS